MAQCKALIASVEPDSPAYDAGFDSGCFLTSIDGHPLRDIIDWRWYSSEDEIEVGYIDLDGEEGTVVLEREQGEDWGFEFEGVVFDKVKLCRNACTFCFMRQLPDRMRSSLTLRDDDFRLSFLSGTFVTLTNLSADDEQRIVEQRISPLRVSLHASNPQVRKAMIGRHAQHGIEALDRLLEAGIEVHAQIVLCPGDNDGDVLRETLEWAYGRPGILGIGIVPVGFTKHQTAFLRSFNDQQAARGVVDVIRPMQQRALAERGVPWVYAADEFYRNAYLDQVIENVPEADCYDEYSMFEDGIGIIRYHLDEWREAERLGATDRCAEALRENGVRACYLVGEAMQPYVSQLIVRAGMSDCLATVTVKNDYFGGNVDVTGLLCGCDIARAVGEVARGERRVDGAFPALDDEVAVLFCVPDIVLNDDAVTLDDMSVEDIEREAGADVVMVSCNPSEFLDEIAAIAEKRSVQYV